MSLVDSAMTREVLRDISKRPLDISELQVDVLHGVVHLRGRIDRIRGYISDIDLQQEVYIITKLLRQKSGVRDVICEVEIGQGDVEHRVAQKDRKKTTNM